MPKKQKVKIKNGDPLLPSLVIGGIDYGSSSYQIRVDSAGAGIDGRWHTILKWNFPAKFVDGVTMVPGGGGYGTHWPVFTLVLQRSATDDNMPYGIDNPFAVSTGLEPRSILSGPEWSARFTLGPASSGLLRITFTANAERRPVYHYRLIMQMGPFLIGPGGVAEVDWNVCTVSLH